MGRFRHNTNAANAFRVVSTVDSASPPAPPPGYGLIDVCVSLSMTRAARLVSGASMRRSAVSFSV